MSVHRTIYEITNSVWCLLSKINFITKSAYSMYATSTCNTAHMTHDLTIQIKKTGLFIDPENGINMIAIQKILNCHYMTFTTHSQHFSIKH